METAQRALPFGIDKVRFRFPNTGCSTEEGLLNSVLGSRDASSEVC
jgi:hypothetical protein